MRTVEFSPLSELAKLGYEHVDVEPFYMLAELAEPHLGHEFIVLRRVANRQRGPSEFQRADHVVIPRRDNDIRLGDLGHHVVQRLRRRARQAALG